MYMCYSNISILIITKQLKKSLGIDYEYIVTWMGTFTIVHLLRIRVF